jgi:hypothetical protein
MLHTRKVGFSFFRSCEIGYEYRLVDQWSLSKEQRSTLVSFKCRIGVINQQQGERYSDCHSFVILICWMCIVLLIHYQNEIEVSISNIRCIN